MFKKNCRFTGRLFHDQEELFKCEKENAWQIVKTMFPYSRDIKLNGPKKVVGRKAIPYSGTGKIHPRRFLGNFCSEKDYWKNIIKLAEIVQYYQWDH